MPTKPLALALAALIMIAPCGRAEEHTSPSVRLHQRSLERGPIRQQLEAALSVPASAIAAQAIEAARVGAHRTSSSPARSSIPAVVWVLIGLACIYALLYEYGRAWSKI